MREFIEQKPVLIIPAMILGCLSFLLSGVLTQIAMSLATINTPLILGMVATIAFGTVTIILPITYLYDSIRRWKNQCSELELRLRRRGHSVPRAQEARHWQTAESPVDDLDGDGEDNDSLRRLGLID